MHRKPFPWLFLFFVMTAVAGMAWQYLGLGDRRTVRILAPLNHPVAVTRWTSNELCLADGRTVLPPGFVALPGESAALAEATQRGVEIDAEGRVWCLVRVRHHSCLGPEIEEQLARVDLSELLIFLRTGITVEAAAASLAGMPLCEETRTLVETYGRTPGLAYTPGGKFSPRFGWSEGEFDDFRCWEDWKKSRASETE